MMSEVHSRALQCAAMAMSLLLLAAVLGCGSASVTVGPARPMPMDGVTLEYIGWEARSQYGYEEIIRLALDAGFLRYPTSEEPNAQNFAGQTMAEAARQAWPVFTRWAVMAGITSQVDSPAPGPADGVALGMLVVGLVRAGVVAAMVLTTSSERERCKKVKQGCIDECTDDFIPSGTVDGMPYHECLRKCLEAANCWKMFDGASPGY